MSADRVTRDETCAALAVHEAVMAHILKADREDAAAAEELARVKADLVSAGRVRGEQAEWIDDLAEELDETRALCETLRREVSDKAAALEKVLGENAKLSKSNQQLVESNEHLTEVNQRYADDWKGQEEALGKADAECLAAENTIVQLRKELASAEKRLDAAVGKARDLEGELSVKKLLMVGLEDDVAALRAAADGMKEVHAAQEKQLATERESVARLHKEAKEHLAKQEALEKKIQELNATNGELLEQLDAAKNYPAPVDVDVNELVAGVLRLLESAAADFEEDPDKSFRNLERAVMKLRSGGDG